MCWIMLGYAWHANKGRWRTHIQMVYCIPFPFWNKNGKVFITGLPKIQGKDCIFVVVNRLTKYEHSFAVESTFSASQVASLFFHEVFKLHGFPKSIVSDRDSKFTRNVWQGLFKLVGTSLDLSASYHPQSDGKIERVNQCMEGYLRSYVTG